MQSDSAFLVRCLDSIMPLLATAEISIKQTKASLYSWAGRFESYMVANLEDRFYCDEAHMAKGKIWFKPLQRGSKVPDLITTSPCGQSLLPV